MRFLALLRRTAHLFHQLQPALCVKDIFGRKADGPPKIPEGGFRVRIETAAKEAGKPCDIQTALQNKHMNPHISREKGRIRYKQRSGLSYGHLCVYPEGCAVLGLDTGEKAALYAPAAYLVLPGGKIFAGGEQSKITGKACVMCGKPIHTAGTNRAK